MRLPTVALLAVLALLLLAFPPVDVRSILIAAGCALLIAIDPIFEYLDRRKHK